MRVGRGEEKTGGRRKQALLADTIEAMIAAIFFDSGYIPARAFVIRIFAEEFQRRDAEHLARLQNPASGNLQAEKRSAPAYNLIKTEGPAASNQLFLSKRRGKTTRSKAKEPR